MEREIKAEKVINKTVTIENFVKIIQGFKCSLELEKIKKFKHGDELACIFNEETKVITRYFLKATWSKKINYKYSKSRIRGVKELLIANFEL